MDPLFWILAGVVVGCVIGIIIIWRLEVQAERRAADTQRVEAEVSERLRVFDPRAAVEEVDTRPIPTAPPPELQQAPSPRPPAAAAPPNLAEKIDPLATPPSRPAFSPDGPPGPSGSPIAADAQARPERRSGPSPFPPRETSQPAPLPAARAELEEVPPQPTISAEPDELRPLPMNGAAAQAAQWGALTNGTAELPAAAEALPSTPEAASLRAAELGRERRYLEQAIEEQQARLEQLMHTRTPGNSQELVAIHVLQSELAEQRHHLEEIIFLEERYRQAATPSLEQLAQDYKNAASPHTPRAFGVRRHSLAPIDPPGKNPPAPPAQAKTDSSL